MHNVLCGISEKNYLKPFLQTTSDTSIQQKNSIKSKS